MKDSEQHGPSPDEVKDQAEGATKEGSAQEDAQKGIKEFGEGGESQEKASS